MGPKLLESVESRLVQLDDTVQQRASAARSDFQDQLDQLETRISVLADAVPSTTCSPAPAARTPEGHQSTPLASLSEDLVVQHVRLGGLRTERLNGCVGHVLGRAPKPGNWKVLLHNDKAPKSIHESNLFVYQPEVWDLCESCRSPIILSAVPPCGCVPTDYPKICS